MNEDTKQFVEELRSRPDVLGVILFGSWARGNARPDSDVDLIVILVEGYRRAIEFRNKQAFEIVYTTPKAALAFWESHKDDCAELWEVAKILHDKNDTIAILSTEAKKLLREGKAPVDEFEIQQLHFDAVDQLKVGRVLVQTDTTLANFILTNKVFELTRLFFDLRQQWVPAPKQRLQKIKEVSPALFTELEKFYAESVPMTKKLEVVEKIITLVFAK